MAANMRVKCFLSEPAALEPMIQDWLDGAGEVFIHHVQLSSVAVFAAEQHLAALVFYTISEALAEATVAEAEAVAVAALRETLADHPLDDEPAVVLPRTAEPPE